MFPFQALSSLYALARAVATVEIADFAAGSSPRVGKHAATVQSSTVILIDNVARYLLRCCETWYRIRRWLRMDVGRKGHNGYCYERAREC